MLKQVVELVMRDEGPSRGVRRGLSRRLDQGVAGERNPDRAEFAYQACAIMRDRLLVWT